MELNNEKRYKCAGFEGVAFRFGGYYQKWEPWTYEDDEGNQVDDGEGEFVDDLDDPMVYMVMVGDDHKHLIDKDDIEELGELDYCAECGQIGCTHDGRDRT